MRARGRRLLFVCIDAGTQGVHEIDYLRRWTLFGWFDLFSGFFLVEQIDQRVLIAVVELGRIEVAGFCLDYMSGEIEHLFRSLELGNVLEIRQLVANFLRRPCRRQHSFELPPYSFKGAAQLDDDGTVRQVRAVHVVR